MPGLAAAPLLKLGALAALGLPPVKERTGAMGRLFFGAGRVTGPPWLAATPGRAAALWIFGRDCTLPWFTLPM